MLPPHSYRAQACECLAITRERQRRRLRAGAGLVRIRVHAQPRRAAERAPASACAFGTLWQGCGVALASTCQHAEPTPLAHTLPLRPTAPPFPTPLSPLIPAQQRGVFTAVRTRTPTREVARVAAAAGACLRAGPLPEPCACCSGTASGGRAEAAAAGVHCDRRSTDRERSGVLQHADTQQK